MSGRNCPTCGTRLPPAEPGATQRTCPECGEVFAAPRPVVARSVSVVEKAPPRQGWTTKETKHTAAIVAAILCGFAMLAWSNRSRDERPAGRNESDQAAARGSPSQPAIQPRLARPDPPPPVHAAEIIGVRLEPFTTAQGRQAQAVYVDWKNSGNRPVRVVDVQIDVFDEEGFRIEHACGNNCIYAEFGSSPGVQPGETWTTPRDRGRILPTVLGPTAARVMVTITRVKELGIPGT
jgi:predicted RNA-binding Zn-ribbon protein involved in translation (DUF1610 family)